MASAGSVSHPKASIRERFVDILNEAVPLKDLTVFEPGCGDGIFTEKLAAVAWRVGATDARFEQIKKTVDRCGYLANAKFMHISSGGDVEPFPDTGTDVIFHVGLLYHLKRPVEHLRKICDAAKVALFLDTHYATWDACNGRYLLPDGEAVLCQEQVEDPTAPRAGMEKFSRWLTKDRIIAELSKKFESVAVIDDRIERNGPRVTILAKRS